MAKIAVIQKREQHFPGIGNVKLSQIQRFYQSALDSPLILFKIKYKAKNAENTRILTIAALGVSMAILAPTNK